MIAIIDYGAGNIFSVENALSFLQIEYVVTSDKDIIKKADKLILPGVGAFPMAMEKLVDSGLVDLIKTLVKEKYLLGICLGMQLLFEKSFEFTETKGLGLIEGTVELMNSKDLSIPQMGWNVLKKNSLCQLSNSFNESDYAYFVHSYAANCSPNNIAAYTEYGDKIPAIVFNNKVFGCQFHPEKSGDVGLNILKVFSKL